MKNYLLKKCMYCNKSFKESLLELYIKIDNNDSIKYFHEECYKKRNNGNFNYCIFDENEKYKLYEKYKNNILNNDYNIDKNFIKDFFLNFESQNYILSGNKKSIDYISYQQEINKLRNKLLNDENVKNVLMGEEINHYESVKNDEIRIKSWIKTWKQKINNYYEINKENINKWIVLKKYDITNKKISYEYKEINHKESKVNLYKFMSYKDSDVLKLVNKEILEKKINETIENYFSDEDKGLIIYKDGNKHKIFLNDRDFISFEGMYDYDCMSQTLIIYKIEGNKRRIGIYMNKVKESKVFNFKYFDELDINSLKDKIIKNIKLIPCINGYINQSVLLFTENEIQIFKFKDSTEARKIINLKENFNYINFEELQFVVYMDFILVLKFDNSSNTWKGKLFSLLFEDKSYFDEIKNVNIEFQTSKNAKFSFSEIRNKKYIFALSYENNEPKINYWEIDCQLSGVFTQNITSEKDENDVEQIFPLGNCILNYFYHCFDKYPFLGAIEYNFIIHENYKKILKLSFFSERQDYIPILKTYINELVKLCQKKKKINFDDVFDFSIKDFYINIKDKDISLGKLLIKCLEIVPIQIAKIMGNQFKIISNGQNMDYLLNIEAEKKRNLGLEAKFNTLECSKLIHFCIKESIFNYELPVIVICCFGTQSVGKSTFLNEITGALFDVSGMRCTEGIWMTVKLFIHPSKIHKNNCIRNCSFCKINQCYLFSGHKNNKCICENCICGQNCQMKGKKNNSNCCDLKCSFKKGHEEFSKCAFENCECKCKCTCICKGKKGHRHICKKCKTKKVRCECSCECKHICKYPIIMHDFICISLDFEGIGKFERTNEQDIQMALIGAAMGNAVIFRVYSSYDKFTDDIMEKLSLGSNKVPINKNIDDYFGGSLFFCPRDINDSNSDEFRNEFLGKINDSVKKWNIEYCQENKKYSIFGLFNNYIFAPTPFYNNEDFYENLRNYLIDEIIVKSFRLNKHPIYETGKQFFSNLKIFLSVVSMNNYEFLTDLREKEIKNYIKENQNKAYEVLGEYEFREEFEQLDYISNLNNLRIYFNNEYLKHLEIDLKNNQKFQENDTLLIDNIYNSENIEGNYNIEEYGITLNVKKKENNNYLFSIDNFKDFGLILSVPKVITKINNNTLCHDFFTLWNDICKKINLKEKNILENFEFFISSLIQRRNQNANKWIQDIAKNNNEILNLQNQNMFLIQNWRICKNKCNFCYYFCCKLLGHQGTHECPYDHKCKEKCQICLLIGCNENSNCQKICDKKAGHYDNEHACNHFHKCLDNCEYYDNCKKKCFLKNGHSEAHRCEISIHYCKDDCFYKDKANNCGGKCTLKYPHPNQEHNCQNEHHCKKECDLKDKRGCLKQCNKKYHEDEKHECGETHYCIDDCIYKDIANNCGGKCTLKYPHPNQEHNCQNQHYCKKECLLKNCSTSSSCHKTCSKFYHIDDEHICDIDKKSHKCNKNCEINENCNNPCSLPANHSSTCQCGRCTCPISCVYYEKSRNCEKNCKYTGGHEGTHKCQLNEHYCKRLCKYKDCSSSGCDIYCKCILEQSEQHTEQSEHVCNNSMNDHKCNKLCNLNQISGCENMCNSSITNVNGHTGYHLCNAANHSCKSKCIFYGNSSNCLVSCKKKVTNNSDIVEYQRFESHTNHICSLSESAHICNKICPYYKQIGVRCNENCTMKVNHREPCKCSNRHVCMEKCKYYNNNECEGCKQYCSSDLGHEGEHFCSVSHRCKGLCYLNGAKGCQRQCIYIYPHSQLHECEIDRHDHICNKNCDLSTYRNCQRDCKKTFGHPGDCSCLNIHYCNKICSFSRCQRNCCLPPGHIEKCACDKTPLYHICNKQCPLRNMSGGCRITCKLDFRHEGDCKCFINENDPHTCLEKCELRNYEKDGNSNTLCGHVYNHKDKNLYCYKCNGNCKIYRKGHLCGKIHKCSHNCNQKGFCIIEPFKEIPKTYNSSIGKSIGFNAAQILEPTPFPCTIDIPENEYEHPNNNIHQCNIKVHRCGFKCKQCNNYCTEDIFHSGLHKCYHANIINSKFTIEGNNYSEIKKKNEYYRIQDKEDAKIFYCQDYCIDQGQGHTHLIHQKEIDNTNDKRVKSYKNNFYECKCSYFWESVLKFQHPLPNAKKIFDKCDCICPCYKDSAENHNYCQLELWHDKELPDYMKGKWISPEGHKFKCDHPSGIYSIFLMDKSGSMNSSSIKPGRFDINYSNNHNNMLGASIEALLDYCNLRAKINRREKCALIGYDDFASIIFKDYYIGDEYKIRDMCLSNLCPNGCTEFAKAFKKAKEILDEIHNKREYIPVIILLTDGIDFYPKKTINYIKNEVSIII